MGSAGAMQAHAVRTEPAEEDGKRDTETIESCRKPRQELQIWAAWPWQTPD